MLDRREHQQEVREFLLAHFPIQDVSFSLPPGSGRETYFVQGDWQRYFVKVGARVERYLAMAEIGLTPPVLCSGQLESGLSILVQPFMDGRNPSRVDYRHHLESVASQIHTMHNAARLREILGPCSSTLHKDAGQSALKALRRRWDRHRAQVPDDSEFVDGSLKELESEIGQFSSEGLVASHNDICNANWIFASKGNIYVLDLESMSMDDPAFDLGALLWWYYPPELRRSFLEVAGYPYDDQFRFRMRVRMALHCLSITLPREGSFDQFNPACYHASLDDFRAILEGRENPQGYDL
jgi:thiamine kinase-like enzyme